MLDYNCAKFQRNCSNILKNVECGELSPNSQTYQIAEKLDPNRINTHLDSVAIHLSILANSLY